MRRKGCCTQHSVRNTGPASREQLRIESPHRPAHGWSAPEAEVAVKAIARRLRRLEDRLGPAIETDFDRQLRARIEAGRQRVAQWCGNAAVAEVRQQEHRAKPGQIRGPIGFRTIVEILHAGRERARQATQAETATDNGRHCPRN